MLFFLGLNQLDPPHLLSSVCVSLAASALHAWIVGPAQSLTLVATCCLSSTTMVARICSKTSEHRSILEKKMSVDDITTSIKCVYIFLALKCVYSFGGLCLLVIASHFHLCIKKKKKKEDFCELRS